MQMKILVTLTGWPRMAGTCARGLKSLKSHFTPSLVLECAHAEEDPSAFEAMRAREFSELAIGTGRSAFSHSCAPARLGSSYWSDARYTVRLLPKN